MRSARHLVIFARYPQLGRGKRRLAKHIGDVEAMRFQRTNLTWTLLRLAADPRWITWLAITPDHSGPWPARRPTVPQGRGDPGHRMAAVIRAMPPGPVVIIGSDIPDITTRHVAGAFFALGHCDAVFGPARDGGYWLAGVRRSPRFIDPFRDVRWSTGHALNDTLKNLNRRKVAFLPTLIDVDDHQSLSQHPDWSRLIRQPKLLHSVG